MNVRKIRIKQSLVREAPGQIKVHNLEIPKTYILKIEVKRYYSRTAKERKENWSIITIDDDFLRNRDVLIAISRLKDKGHLYVYGRNSFGINWDAVLEMLYSSPGTHCFFCNSKLTPKSKTKDHLVSREILKAFGLYQIPDNTLPCCLECNRMKGGLDPYMWRVKLKTLIKERHGHDYKWKAGLKVMNKILLEKKDPTI